MRGHHYEDLSTHAGVFAQLEEAVILNCVVSLELLKDGQKKAYCAVQPYRLVNTKGIWYLAALHEGRLKTFGVGKIRSVHVQTEKFSRDKNVDASIQIEEGIWHSPQSQKLLLSVAPQAAEYFKRRQLVPHQKVTHEAADGTLTIETTVGHPNQILPIVRYWMPSVRILSPEDWNEHLVEQLSGYLNELTRLHRASSATPRKLSK